MGLKACICSVSPPSALPAVVFARGARGVALVCARGHRLHLGFAERALHGSLQPYFRGWECPSNAIPRGCLKPDVQQSLFDV